MGRAVPGDDAWRDGRLLPSSPAPGYSGHRARYGPLPTPSLAALIAATSAVSLVGRGGAGFPVSRKLSALADAGRPPVLIVNWCEGDPTAVKDEALAHRSPHLVLDGVLALAGAARARRLIIACRAGSATAGRVGAAVAQRPEAGRCEVLSVPPRLVASEASSLVSLASGGGARPLGRLAPIWERGVDGAPTMVLNAETSAQLAVLAMLGPAGFATVGDPGEPGTAVLSVSGRVARPGTYEIPTGTAIGIPLLAAGAPGSGWALVGGLAGRWVEVERLGRTAFSGAALQAAGLSRGVGSIVVLGDGCLLVETAGILGYLARESAGRCGPCMFGLPAIAADLAALVAGDPAAPERLRRRLPVIDGRGGCAHPDGAVALAGSALAALSGPLRGHLDAHLRGGPCGARPVLSLGGS